MYGSGGIAPFSLTTVLDGGEFSASHSGRFIPGKRGTGTHHVRGWVVLRFGLDGGEQRNIC
jgi:hypothetical protein